MDEQQSAMPQQAAPSAPEAEGRQATQPPKHSKGAAAAISICSGVLLCLQVLLMLLYLLGIVTLFGDPVDLNMFLELIESIARFNGASAYYILMGFAFAILYLVMFIVMVRTFVVSLKNSIFYWKKKTTAYARAAMIELSEHLAEMFFFQTCIPIVIAALLGETYFSTSAIVMLILVPMGAVASDIIARLTSRKRQPAVDTAFGIAQNALMYVVFCLIVVFLNEPAFQNFIRGAGILFSGNLGFDDGFLAFLHLFYIQLVEPVLYVILLAFSYNAMRTALFLPQSVRKVRLKDSLKHTVIYTAVLLGLQFVFGALLAGGMDGMSVGAFGDWFLLVRESYLPLFALLLGSFLLEALWGDPVKTGTGTGTATTPAATHAN